jgi:hypothetical protein
MIKPQNASYRDLFKGAKVENATGIQQAKQGESVRSKSKDSNSDSLSMQGVQKRMFETTKEQSFNLHFNRNNLVVRIDDSQKLTLLEKERLKQMIDEEKKKYKQEAEERFDSRKNRSIMIQDKHNDLRNEVMRRVYSRQLEKRRKPHFKNLAI